MTRSLTDREVASAAICLYKAEKSGTQTSLPSLDFPNMTMDDAYRIQKQLVGHKVACGERPVGHKIGLTSRAMQLALGIEIPDSGVLFDTMLLDSGSVVERGRYIEPRVEAEIVFVMGNELAAENLTRQDVVRATSYVSPALEIVDTRVFRKDPETGTARNVLDTIADNAANAGLVIGPSRHAADNVDLRWIGSIVRRDGVVEETGLGAGVLDDPFTSVIWLARRLARYGQPIQPGDIVLSGSFVRPVEAPPGSRFEADFGDFGKVEVAFE